MNLYAISGLVTIATSVSFGGFVYLRDRRRALNQVWFLYTLCVAGYGALAFAVANAGGSMSQAYILWRALLIIGAPIWIPAVFFHFVCIFCDIKKGRMIAANYLIAGIFILLDMTPYSILGVRYISSFSFYYPIPYLPVFVPLMAWWIGLTIWSYVVLWRAYPRASEAKRLQIRYFFVAMALTYSTGSLAWVPYFHLDLYPAWGTFGISFYPVIMSYAIAAHQLLEIKVAIKKAFLTCAIIVLSGWGLIGMLALMNVLLERGSAPLWALALGGGAAVFLIGDYIWRRYQELERLQYEFITVAAHKLRTPLTHIRWSLDDLDTAPSLEEARHIGTEIKNSNSRLIEITNSLLASLEERKKRSILGPVDLSALARTIVTECEPEAKYKSIELSMRAEAEDLRAIADEEKLSAVLQILLENAILYTPAGGRIEVSLGVHNRDFVIAQIRDTGIGINRADLQNIFQRLYRGRNASAVDTEGLGLGLFMAKRMIDAQQGIIGADSEGLGQGSTFWFILPRAAAGVSGSRSPALAAPHTPPQSADAPLPQ